MTDDVLARATRALRQTTTETSTEDDSQAERTCRLVLRKLDTRRRFAFPRRRLFMLSLIAAMLVSGAWSFASGRISVVLREAFSAHWMGRAANAPAIRPALPSPPAPETPAREIALAPPASVAAPVARTNAPLPKARVPKAPRIAEAPRVIESPAAPSVSALYAEAHAAHFKRHDYAAALAAWDRYLREARETPDGGTLALEARYNRAIALMRLGRREEAATALRPFARGEYGPYRQSEAQRLMDTFSR